MSRKNLTVDRELGDDLIWGVGGKNGIAAFLNIKPAKAYYLIERGTVPVKKFGHRTIAASRSELRRLFTSSNNDSAA